MNHPSSSPSTLRKSPIPRFRKAAFRAGCALAIVVNLAGFHTPAAAAEPAPFTGVLAGKALGVPASATNPYLYNAYVWGSGPTNLGNVAIMGHHTAYADIGSLVRGFIVISTRQGLIFGTYSGSETFTPDPYVIDVAGSITLTGGTGRCRGATGNLAFNGALQIQSISPTGVIDEGVRLAFGGMMAMPGRR